MAGSKIALTSTSGELQQDANGNAKVNLPTNADDSGFAQLAYTITSNLAKVMKISEDNSIYVAEVRQLMNLDFNSASTAWSGKIGTNATTMTKGVQNGFMRLNNSAITTTATGIAIYTNRVINIEGGYDYRVRFQLKHSNATATNKQAEFGLGYYAFAAGQAAAMNEFIGFRFGTTGGLSCVVATSQGGAATETETIINSNSPFSDNVSRDYEIIITDTAVEFYVEGVYRTRISKPNGAWGVFKSISYPFIARVFNSGTASAAATFDIGDTHVFKIGADDGIPGSFRLSAMDKSSYYAQPDIIAAATATHNLPASGTVPTAATGSNTASVLNNTAQMGGFFQMNGASIGATNHSTIWVAGYQNPAIPTAAGAVTNARNFYITSITISPLVVGTVLAGGGFAANWFAAIGSTALSSATTDTDGTTAVAQKADRLVPMSRITSFAAAAAAGTIETGQGDFTTIFATPLVIHPGEFLKIGLRTVFVSAAVTSGTLFGSINVNGYWD